jgi:Uma2 family endonuclease
MPLPWSLWRSDFPFIFTKFPNSKYGMEFLRHYDMRRQAWTNFAHWYATRRRAENQEYELQTGLIYEEAFKHFPDDGFLFQAASLFWRRQRNYARAVEICKTAIAKGLRDGTKSGFEGRVRRLEKEARTAENSSALA